ncbi:YjbQ family protein [Alteromonas sediminis]|uniref:YjbQ family protein n=1 Tax=Alteromonas sediminis TaxID=2259342 RepID=A0A3N5YAU4_9ALTE|nr:secondary thiamine-phosphate synthase enzyme YjbQ [Alteromonas sediminis]RPJ65975.1 YjbQ family protein [Alteromonas sediminis]
MSNSVFQTELLLPSMPRGFHLITDKVQSAVASCELTGLMNVFIQHTSASLTINENADPTVRQDFESHFNQMVPENAAYYKHTYEGSDDMPAHLKSSILGTQVTVPITNGHINLGTWQGIYLCEHRNQGGRRRLVLTVMGCQL